MRFSHFDIGFKAAVPFLKIYLKHCFPEAHKGYPPQGVDPPE